MQQCTINKNKELSSKCKEKKSLSKTRLKERLIWIKIRNLYCDYL